jgi:hypothetical protein
LAPDPGPVRMTSISARGTVATFAVQDRKRESLITLRLSWSADLIPCFARVTDG